VIRLLAAALLSLLALAQVQAQGYRAAAQACRGDYRRLCAGTAPGGGRVLACLSSRTSELSDPCRAALLGARDRRRASAGGAADAHAARVLRDVAYGTDPAQRFDAYLPTSPRRAPIIVMLHGGAWAIGDKAAGRVVDAKVRHWLPRGYILVSVNTRLIPRADPVAQARDLAAAVASVRSQALGWGGDPGRLVLMGHSSGAHVAALLTADPSIGEWGRAPWLGTVAIDSAAYDVPRIMAAPHMRLYDRAFGVDEAFWAAASPLHRLRPGVRPMLLVCSTLRAESCPQARAFAQAAGRRASVAPVALRHGALNAELGTEGAYTATVDRFLRALGLP
jgi:acetyl esterase/lipase